MTALAPKPPAVARSVAPVAGFAPVHLDPAWVAARLATVTATPGPGASPPASRTRPGQAETITIGAALASLL